MADISGGGLNFTANLDNEQLNAAVDETMRRVQGMSDAIVGSGEQIDDTANTIRATLEQIGNACALHETELESLRNRYDSVGKEMAAAFAAGRDDEYRALRNRQQAIKGEIAVRERLLKELREQSDALEIEAQKMDKATQEAQKMANAHTPLRTQIRDLKEEMARLRMQGIDENSEAYKKLVNELGVLQDIQGDIMTQGRIMSNDENQFAGMLSGLSGLVGGFTAAQGAISLFAGENENLQKIMLKVQSLMSITMGLQQVQQTLNKDSAFKLVTLNNLKEWWNKLLAVGRHEQELDNAATAANSAAVTTNTAATAANAAARETSTAANAAASAATAGNTTATAANAAAATAGTAANIGLAGAFRMVGAAIKSIPVFGWILAGISALIGLVSVFNKKASESKKEMAALVKENYKSIGSITELSERWKRLGNDLEAKKKFIRENKEEFDKLGATVRDVADAQELLIKNKDAFVNAQIAKAKSLAVLNSEEYQEAMQKSLEAQLRLEKATEEYKKKYRVESTATMKDFRKVGRGYGVGAKNASKDMLEAMNDLHEANEVMKKAFGKSLDYEKEYNGIVENINKEALKKNANTIRGIKELIQQKREAIEDMTDPKEIAKVQKEIRELERTLNLKIGQPESGKKDPFVERLEKIKSEYVRFTKWINSGDKILAKAAYTEFDGLLKQGASYINYLQNQRQQLLEVGKDALNKSQLSELKHLNDAIAEETKNTVLEAFNRELSQQLESARGVVEMLKIIEDKKKELSKDDTDLGAAKKEKLNEEQEKAEKKAREEVEAMLKEYEEGSARKRRITEQYNNDIALLDKARAKATSEAEIEAIDAVIKKRKEQYREDSKTSGNAKYDDMLADFGSFEERKQAIIDKYEAKRRVAEEMGNKEMVAEIDKAQKKALSDFAINMLKASPDWELMFGDLDEVSTRKLGELLDKINSLDGAYLGIQFDPQDLATLKEKIAAIKREIQERNPFKSLIRSVKEYSKAVDEEEKKKSFKKMFDSAASSIGAIKGAFDSVVGGIEKMGITMDESTQSIMNDIGGMIDGAGQLAQGIASGNPLSMIQGSIGLLSSTFSLFNSRDRRANRSIKRHKEQVDRLSNAYKQLEWQINKALGGEVYKNQKAAIRNMQQQQAHLSQMIYAENTKKKTDHDKINAWSEQIADLSRQIDDMFDSIAEDILQTNAKDFSKELGDALVDAFSRGEDASKAFEKTVNDVLKNAIVNQLKKQFLEKELQSALKNLNDSMGYWRGDEFVFDGLSDREIQDFKDKVKVATTNYQQALNAYKDVFADLSANGEESALTGAVKGITEESAGVIAGQANAVRINQLEGINIMRNQLMQLTVIAQNTAYNRHLAKIDRVIYLLETRDTMRAQGLS